MPSDRQCSVLQFSHCLIFKGTVAVIEVEEVKIAKVSASAQTSAKRPQVGTSWLLVKAKLHPTLAQRCRRGRSRRRPRRLAAARCRTARRAGRWATALRAGRWAAARRAGRRVESPISIPQPAPSACASRSPTGVLGRPGCTGGPAAPAQPGDLLPGPRSQRTTWAAGAAPARSCRPSWTRPG